MEGTSYGFGMEDGMVQIIMHFENVMGHYGNIIRIIILIFLIKIMRIDRLSYRTYRKNREFHVTWSKKHDEIIIIFNLNDKI